MFSLFKHKRQQTANRDREYYVSRFRSLSKELVPPMYEADTKQGEMVRCIGNLKDESSRNGNANWDELNEEEVDFLMAHLPDPERLDNPSCDTLRCDLEQIRKAGRSGHGEGENFEKYFSVEDEVFFRVMCHVVDWCDVHPDPVQLRPQDPNVRRFEKDDESSEEFR